jgi:hypothetical protein
MTTTTTDESIQSLNLTLTSTTQQLSLALEAIEILKQAQDTEWLLLTAFLILLMQAGFSSLGKFSIPHFQYSQ